MTFGTRLGHFSELRVKGRYESFRFKSSMRCFPTEVASRIQCTRHRHHGPSQASRILSVMKNTTCGIYCCESLFITNAGRGSNDVSLVFNVFRGRFMVFKGFVKKRFFQGFREISKVSNTFHRFSWFSSVLPQNGEPCFFHLGAEQSRTQENGTHTQRITISVGEGDRRHCFHRLFVRRGR